MNILFPLHLFFSWGLSGAAQRQTGGSFIRKKLYPLHLFFSMGKLGGSRGHIGGSFIRKKSIPQHLFFFEYWGD